MKVHLRANHDQQGMYYGIRRILRHGAYVNDHRCSSGSQEIVPGIVQCIDEFPMPGPQDTGAPGWLRFRPAVDIVTASTPFGCGPVEKTLLVKRSVSLSVWLVPGRPRNCRIRPRIERTRPQLCSISTCKNPMVG
jgi:hypothetical protein